MPAVDAALPMARLLSQCGTLCSQSHYRVRRSQGFANKQDEQMQTPQRIGSSVPKGPIVLQTDEARQGVTGHNVRYVLGFGLFGTIVGFALVGFLATRGWLGAG
jgi:hypothetical protein